MSDSETLQRKMVEIHHAVEPLAAEWEELARQMGASPFRRPGWFAAWWRAFGKGSLEILAIRREGELVGVIPLRRRLGALTSITNWHTPEFGPIAADSPAMRTLARELFATAPRRVALGFVDVADSSLSELAEAAAASGYRALTRALELSPYVSVEGGWESYEDGLSRNVRGDVKRRIRRLREAGSVTIEVEDGSSRLDRFLEEGFRVEAAGWKGAGGTAIVSKADTERFYREVAEWAAPRGWLRLAFLRLDRRAIAFHYSLVHEGVHYFVKGGHDESFDSFSPGKVLTYEMLRQSFAAGLRSYEFLGGDDPWKRLWTSSSRERRLFLAFGGSATGSAQWAVQRYGQPAVKRLARTWPVTLLRT
jgi:CelD/BcsL family acetyltransferase involved in cellulose biosynthesis